MNKEIEKKYLVKEVPNLENYVYIKIEQGYLYTEDPIIRVRRFGENYFLTYKKKLESEKDAIVCEEYELPITKEAYNNLKQKTENNMISKCRYIIEIDNGLKAELDIFEGLLEGLVLVEVEFKSVEQLKEFNKPIWFGEDVTDRREFRNSELSKVNLPKN